MKASSFNNYRIYIYLRQRMGFLWLGTKLSLLYAICLLSILKVSQSQNEILVALNLPKKPTKSDKIFEINLFLHENKDNFMINDH